MTTAIWWVDFDTPHGEPVKEAQVGEWDAYAWRADDGYYRLSVESPFDNTSSFQIRGLRAHQVDAAVWAAIAVLTMATEDAEDAEQPRLD